jgi:hypothetical protein
MTESNKVFIGKTPGGEAILDADIAVLQRAGAENIVAIPVGEYRRLGGREAVITFEGGAPRLGLSESARKATRKREIHARFEELDRLRVRPVAALAEGGSAGDREYLERLNAEAAALREELAAL